LSATTITRESGKTWSVIRLSSPSGLNRLGTETLELLYSELVTALSEDNCRCLAIVGEGRSFAVGADLREVARLNPKSARDFSDLGNSVFRLLEDSETIIVAGIDGFCLGGGLDFALSADWRIASSSSIFGHPGADLGIITGFGGTQRLPRLIGPHRSFTWILTAAKVGAEEAYESGFLQEICRQDEFQGRLEKRLKWFAGMPSEWIRTVKNRFRYLSDAWLGSGCL
jgi:enoyl-CoA hydratase